MAKARLKKRPEEPEDLGPTPETQAKVTPDPLWILFCTGRVKEDQLRAAQVIVDAYTAITAPVRVRISNPENETRRGYADPWELPAKMVDAVKSYNRWADQMNDRRWPVGPVLDVVIERKSCREVAAARRVRQTRIAELVSSGLSLFCVLEGWRRST